MLRPQPLPQPIAVGDLGARRITALARVVLSFVIVALASVDAVVLPTWFTWLAGLAWFPAASALWLAEEGPPDQRRTLVGLVIDLAALTTIMWLAPDHATTALLLLVALAAAVTYQSGARTGVLFLAVGVACRWLVAAVHPVDVIDVPLESAIGVVAVGVVLLTDRAVRVQRRDARSVRRFADTSSLIINRSTEGIVLTDGAGVVVSANPAAERVLAAADDDPLVGGHCTDRLGLHADGAVSLDCRTSCALAELCAGDDQGVEVWRQVGDVRQPLLASATPITGLTGRTEFLHSFRDISRLKEADEAKTMFLATASHELKTPLTVIRGFTQLLLEQDQDDRSRTALEAIESRSRDLAAIVDRLLLSSRIDAGRVEIVVEEVDVSGLLECRLAGVAASLGRRLDVRIDPGLRALASRDALVTVLDHLVDNATKYSPSGTPVSIVARDLHDEVVIEVADGGIGMTPEQVERCFEKFWQAESTDVRRFGGTGIGLYIVRSLVEGMDGRVGVTSTPGVGTTFTVRLAVRAAVPVGPIPPPEGARVVPRASVDEFMQQLGLSSGVS